MRDEFTRQPVEQFRMHRPCSCFPEIIGCFDQADAKMMLPHSVNENTGSQWIRRARDPVGQLPSSFLFRRIRREDQRIEKMEGGRRNLFAFLHWVAAMQTEGLCWRPERPGVGQRWFREGGAL